jgi:Spy/CpxP family protein refolding chaperone
MSKRFLLAAGLVAAMAAGTAVSFAQGPRPGGPGIAGPGRVGPRGVARADLGLRGVQLSDAQRDQVRSIMQSHRTEFDNTRKALAEARRAFAEATRAATYDEATIRARSTAVATAMAEDAILRAKVRAEVHGLLTAEQQQQLKEREAAMQKRAQERQQRLQQRRQQRPPQ